MQPRRQTDGIWDYPPLEEALGGAGLEGIRKSVTRRYNTVEQYIAMRPIMDLCERSIWRLGAWVSRWWWEQEGLDLEEANDRAEEELDGENTQYEEGAAQEKTPGRELGRCVIK